MPYNYRRLSDPIENRENTAFLSNVEIKKENIKNAL